MLNDSNHISLSKTIIIIISIIFACILFFKENGLIDETIYLSADQINNNIINELDLPTLPEKSKFNRLIVQKRHYWLEDFSSQCILTVSIPKDLLNLELLEKQSADKGLPENTINYKYYIIDNSNDDIVINFYWGTFKNNIKTSNRPFETTIDFILPGFNTHVFNNIIIFLGLIIFIILFNLPYKKMIKNKWIIRIIIFAILWTCIIPKINLYISLQPDSIHFESVNLEDEIIIKQITEGLCKWDENIKIEKAIFSRNHKFEYMTSLSIVYSTPYSASSVYENQTIIQQDDGTMKAQIHLSEIMLNKEQNDWINSKTSHQSILLILGVSLSLIILLPYELFKNRKI